LALRKGTTIREKKESMRHARDVNSGLRSTRGEKGGCSEAHKRQRRTKDIIRDTGPRWVGKKVRARKKKLAKDRILRSRPRGTRGSSAERKKKKGKRTMIIGKGESPGKAQVIPMRRGKSRKASDKWKGGIQEFFFAGGGIPAFFSITLGS